MRTRTEQVQAYRFVTRRIVSALLSGEPETTERPMRRFGMAIFGGSMLAVIVFAVVGVIGFLNPAGGALEDKSIVIERETGARFVFADNRLHPVLNYTSARLALENPNPPVRTMSQRALRAFPRGPVIGIPNAPDALPDRSALTRSPWSVCNRRRDTGSRDYLTQLIVGDVPSGGRAVGEAGIMIKWTTTANRVNLSLIWNGHRHLISDRAQIAIGLGDAQPVEVTTSFVNSMPAGPNLAVPQIDDAGKTGRSIAGEPGRIGRVYLAAGQHYVLLNSGLAPIGEVMKDLLIASGNTITEIPANAAAAARSDDEERFDPDGFPATKPEMVFDRTEPAMLCSVHTPAGDGTVGLMTYADPSPSYPLDQGDVDRARTGLDSTRQADVVVVPNGRGALVRTQPVTGDATPNLTTYLITDTGLKYALPRANVIGVAAMLGYEGIPIDPVISPLISLIPTGPTLEPGRARGFINPVVSTPRAPTPPPSSSPTPAG